MTLRIEKNIPDTSFAEALENFREFLSGQKLSNQLLWLFQQDVIYQNEKIFVKTPISSENERLAKSCYELGQKRSFGINLQAFCLLESQICCYIHLPQDELDAQYSLMSTKSLKYSVWLNLKQARPISNALKWKILKLSESKSGSSKFDNYIPSKFSLLPEFPVYAPTD